MPGVLQEATITIRNGSNLDIDAAAEQLTTVDVHCYKGVLVKADDDNQGDVYVGGAGVTAGTVEATDGIRLKAGDSVFLPINHPASIYVIASVANQKAWWIAM